MIMLLAVKFDVFCGQFSIDSFKSGTFALFMLAVICPESFESKTSKDASYTLKMELLAVVSWCRLQAVLSHFDKHKEID